MDYEAVPNSLRRLWRLPMPPARLGRKSALDIDAVVSTAVRLADDGGLDAATLPRVAEELGVTAMSLYRYVGSKQELLLLMVDAASEPQQVETEPAGWRDGLRSWAFDLWELSTRRPWIPRVPVYSIPSGPNQIAWMERALAALSDTDVEWGDKLVAIGLLSGYVRQSVLLTEELREGRPVDEEQAENEYRYGLALRELIDPDQFPHLADMLGTDVFVSNDNSSAETARRDFGNGLDLVLDGLEMRIGPQAKSTGEKYS